MQKASANIPLKILTGIFFERIPGACRCNERTLFCREGLYSGGNGGKAMQRIRKEPVPISIKYLDITE